ncbi:MAG: VWA domain-containing protein [Luteitalea sp.]|nr:VWA domain-containing protein [Luteitalea sp.]
MASALVLIATSGAGAGAAPGNDPTKARSLQITSPLGRTGLPGTVRIVARVLAPAGEPGPAAVRFYVNGVLIATDTDGPPYVAEWEDENPFEPCTLAVEADDVGGGAARDSVELTPFTIVEASDITSVGVDAVVLDARGRFVGGLAASQFILREDGLPQTIDLVMSDAPAATFTLLIDSSQSMSANARFVQNAAVRLAAFLRDEDRVVVAPFRKGITAITGPTRDPATIADAVAAATAQGGTAIVDALQQVSGHAADGERRRVVVLVTDGYDEHSRHSFEATLASLKAGQVTVYVVAIGGVAGISLRGEQLLRQIARETGGRAFFPWNSEELAAAHAAIAADVQHRYRLAYTPTNQQKDGTWRAITLSATDPSYRVRARSGYQALHPPPVRASVEFTATDHARQYVDLAIDDMEVIEDGVIQHVDVFHEAVAPVAIVLAVDASGSMSRAAGIVRQAAAHFVETVRPGDRLAVVQFADKAELVADFEVARDGALAALHDYAPAGGTALYDALHLSVQRLSATAGRRAIVVVTDGRDENAASTAPGSVATWDTVIAAAHATDATVYAIGLGVRVERGRLQQLADLTGGEAYFTDDLATLDAEYRRVLEDLHRRYVLGYTSTNAKRDGAWRAVELRSPAKPVRLRSRGGYFAPGQ